MEEMIASNVCRLCLWKTAPLIPIFGSNNLYEKITQLVPISIHPGNGLSQLICGECLYKVELFNEFRSSALKCDKMQQDYRQLWESHLLSEIDRMSSADVNGRYRLPQLAVGRIKTEPPSCDAPTRTTRSSERHKDGDKEAWPAEVDPEEVTCLTEERPKRRSTSLYSRAPCSESPGCPYICRYCKKELPTSADLAGHERKHTDYVCLVCDEKLPGEKELRLHVRTVCNRFSATNQEPESKVPDENFKCSTCQRIFCSPVALWRHCVCLSHSQPQTMAQQNSSKPGTQKCGTTAHYSKETMEKIVQDIAAGRIGQREAARKYDIPRHTIRAVFMGTKSPQEVEKDLPKRPVGRPVGTVGRGGSTRGRGMTGYSRGRGTTGYGRGRGTTGYGRGRGKKKMIFTKRPRVWVYDKTPCDVCGRIFTSSCGMLIHRTHAHKQ